MFVVYNFSEAGTVSIIRRKVEGRNQLRPAHWMQLGSIAWRYLIPSVDSNDYTWWRNRYEYMGQWTTPSVIFIRWISRHKRLNTESVYRVCHLKCNQCNSPVQKWNQNSPCSMYSPGFPRDSRVSFPRCYHSISLD
jgi:hypothetical protein